MFLFFLLNAVFLRDKEGGDGSVDPKVTDLDGPTHMLKGPPKLGPSLCYYFHVIILNV